MENNAENIQKLNQLLEKVNIGMLTTIAKDGSFHSRPMGTQNSEIAEGLWFFTDQDSEKVKEIQADSRVNVIYSEQAKDLWISISGKASVVTDKKQLQDKWSPILKAWFPGGIETPGLCLIKVEASGAEYWDNPAGKVVELYGLVKGALTGEKEDLGENKTVTL